jgi:hypothetical protein
MATLAPVTPVALVAPAEAFSFGTAAAAFNGSDLHGQDFKALRRFLLVERSRTQELAEQILAPDTDESLTYNPVPPLRTFYVNAVFERGAAILPVPFELDDD